MTREQRKRFLPLCPDFLVELTSPTDRLSKVQEKMQEWISNGASLGWILDADNRQAYIYRSNGVEILNSPDRLAGEAPVQGFVLELSGIWDPAW